MGTLNWLSDPFQVAMDREVGYTYTYAFKHNEWGSLTPAAHKREQGLTYRS
jgi:hypothetical protein